jgi:hypothetical protein
MASITPVMIWNYIVVGCAVLVSVCLTIYTLARPTHAMFCGVPAGQELLLSSKYVLFDPHSNHTNTGLATQALETHHRVSQDHRCSWSCQGNKKAMRYAQLDVWSCELTYGSGDTTCGTLLCMR